MTYIPTLKSAICGPKMEFLHFISIVNNVDTLVTLIIPFISIVNNVDTFVTLIIPFIAILVMNSGKKTFSITTWIYKYSWKQFVE